MSSLESVMWRAEVEPRLRSDGVVVELLDRVPDWDRLQQAHLWGASLVPRLRQRVVEDLLRLGPPTWVDADLDLGYHMSRVRLSDGGGLEQVLELAAALLMAPFDPARPLWQSVLVEGLPNGTAAFIMKAHHSLSDGTGAIQLFDLLHSSSPEPSGRGSAPALRPSTGVSTVGLAATRGVDVIRGAVPQTLRLLHGVASMRPRTATGALHYARSLARISQPPADPSPLLQPRGLSRRLRVLEVPVADLRAAGKAEGCSLNDAYLAALLGGLRLYHLRCGADPKDLPMAFPVAVRATSDAPGGNHFAAVSMAGPLGDLSPQERIREVSRRSRSARSEPALDFLSRLAPVMSRIPSSPLASLSLRVSERIDLQASNIPGLTRTSYVAGARVDRMFVFGPTPGCAVMATLVSHNGTCCIGITVDHDAVPDPDLLMSCMQEALTELVGTQP
jgi:diacylglycerol O-acyltransferase